MNIWKFKKRNIKISTLNVWNSRMWLNKIEERINSNIKLIKSSKSIRAGLESIVPRIAICLW